MSGELCNDQEITTERKRTTANDDDDDDDDNDDDDDITDYDEFFSTLCPCVHHALGAYCGSLFAEKRRKKSPRRTLKRITVPSTDKSRILKRMVVTLKDNPAVN